MPHKTSKGNEESNTVVTTDKNIDNFKQLATEHDVDPEAAVLALEALQLTRDTLMMRHRFLDRALWKMTMRPATMNTTLATNAESLYFDPVQVFQCFSENPDELARDLLHVIFHCVFYHPFVPPDMDKECWCLATDIVAERVVMELTAGRPYSEHDEEREQVALQLEGALGTLSAEKLYLYLSSEKLDSGLLGYYRTLFKRDDHTSWFREEDPDGQQGAGVDDDQDAVHMKSQQGNSSDDGGNNSAQEDEDGSDAADSASKEESGQDNEGSDQDNDDSQSGEETSSNEPKEDSGPSDSSKKDWEYISKRMKIELESSAKRYGTEAGSLAIRLKAANRKRYDYRTFLQKFARMHEEMHLSPDEFDLVYYSFGIDTYGNIPLIEPLEYRDTHKIHDFVIAIDTSGSVQGELIQLFIEETYAILEETGCFTDKFRIRLVQCDAVVQSETVLHSREEVRKHMEQLEIRGGGGTDFRPVFELIDQKIKSREITDLRGLVYFTDGRGTYPSLPPDYDSAFVLFDDGHGVAKTPVWAYKLVLDEFQLRLMSKNSFAEQPSPLANKLTARETHLDL